MTPKNKNPRFWRQVLEESIEFGQDTTKKAKKEFTRTFSPLNLLELTIRGSNAGQYQENEKPSPKNNSTPLDLGKLNKAYQSQEESKTAGLRQRLFQLVKKEEEEVIIRKKKEKEERKRREQIEEEEKKAKEKEHKKRQQMEEIPKGKVRRSILSAKRKIHQKLAEFKPGKGKQ